MLVALPALRLTPVGPLTVLIPLSPEILLRAYAAGIFPMAETADDPELFWVDPRRRGIIPLDAFHVPRRCAGWCARICSRSAATPPSRPSCAAAPNPATSG